MRSNKAYYPRDKKHRSTAVSGLISLLDSRATNNTIKIKHTKHYERKMQSNKVEYSTASGVYCTTHYIKVPFCMSEFSSCKIINQRFHVNNYKGELGICYDMFIGSDLMVQLGLMDDFKCQFLRWNGDIAHMEESSIFLGKSLQLSARYARWLCRL